MFNNNQKPDDNVVQPASTKPVNDGLLGLNDDNVNKDLAEAKTTVEETKEVSADIATHIDESNNTPDEKPAEDTPEASDDAPESAPDLSSATTGPDGDLLDLKREALEELSPLVDKLDQTPEELFETLLMMIQATDNKSLVGNAFKAAKEITDENKRAQALLDVVNEINYFTQPKK